MSFTILSMEIVDSCSIICYNVFIHSKHVPRKTKFCNSFFSRGFNVPSQNCDVFYDFFLCDFITGHGALLIDILEILFPFYYMRHTGE